MGFTSFILAAGFCVSLASQFRGTIEFGFLLAVVLLVALIASLCTAAAVITGLKLSAAPAGLPVLYAVQHNAQ